MWWVDWSGQVGPCILRQAAGTWAVHALCKAALKSTVLTNQHFSQIHYCFPWLTSLREAGSCWPGSFLTGPCWSLWSLPDHRQRVEVVAWHCQLDSFIAYLFSFNISLAAQHCFRPNAVLEGAPQFSKSVVCFCGQTKLIDHLVCLKKGSLTVLGAQNKRGEKNTPERKVFWSLLPWNVMYLPTFPWRDWTLKVWMFMWSLSQWCIFLPTLSSWFPPNPPEMTFSHWHF